MTAIFPAAELETSPAGQQTEEPKPEAELERSAGGEGEGTGDDPDALDDFEYAGEKYRVAKSSKDAIAKAFDGLSKEFTTTSQKRARELDERAQRIEEQAKAADDEMNHRVALRSINAQLEQYAKFPPEKWAELKANNYEQYNEHQRNWRDLKDAKRDTEGKISDAVTKRSHDAESAATRRIDEAEAYAAKELKGWNAASGEEMVKYMAEKAAHHKMEVPAVLQMMASNMSPLFIDLLHKARIGEEALKRASAPKPPAEPPVPLETVGAKTPAASPRPSDKDDMDTWMKKWTKQQEKRKG